jgi:hypothetical protein
MTPDVCAAVQLGQARLARTGNHHRQRCLELALDELLRRPERAGSPAGLLDAALAHARTHIRRRRAIRAIDAGSHRLDQPSSDAAMVQSYEVAITELTDWLRRSTLTDRQQSLLLLAIADCDETTACDRLGLRPLQLRQASARARQAARAARDRELVAA